MVFNFDQLLQRLAGTDEYLQKRAVVAVNRAATFRSWCFRNGVQKWGQARFLLDIAADFGLYLIHDKR
jgi:hypothetical protein